MTVDSGTQLNTNEMVWESTPSVLHGAEGKVLRDGTQDGTWTVLLRLPPGWEIRDHRHTSTEERFVLAGEYTIDGVRCGAGTYQMIPAGEAHERATSAFGCELLVRWD